MSLKSERSSITLNLKTMGVSESDQKKVISSIVGIRGSNISRLRKLIPGVYIRVFSMKYGMDTRVGPGECDMVYVAGRNKEDVSKCVIQLKKEIKLTLVGDIEKLRPTLFVSCPSYIVGIVIGNKGLGLKKIQLKCGDGCFIVYDNSKYEFKITAVTQFAIKKAEYLIKKTINDYNKKVPTRTQTTTPIVTSKSNIYDSISYDDESDESDDESDDVDDESDDVGGESDDKSTMELKSRSEERWEIRNMLSLKKNLDGTPVYPSFEAKDYNTGDLRLFEGVYAVPWYAVDKHIEENNEKKDIVVNNTTGYSFVKQDYPALLVETKEKSKKQGGIWDDFDKSSFSSETKVSVQSDYPPLVENSKKSINCVELEKSSVSSENKSINSPIKKAPFKIDLNQSWADMCEDDSDY